MYSGEVYSAFNISSHYRRTRDLSRKKLKNSVRELPRDKKEVTQNYPRNNIKWKVIILIRV